MRRGLGDKRHFAWLVAAAAALGVLGYAAYTAYTAPDAEDADEDDGQYDDADGGISEHGPASDTSSTGHSPQTPSPSASSLGSSASTPGRTPDRRALVTLSANGILLDGLHVRPSARAIVEHLEGAYRVYVVVRVAQAEDEERVVRVLEDAGVADRRRVLVCQTDEGRAHLVRHLLTAGGVAHAGHVDTDAQVVRRLAPVLRRVVHVAGAQEAPAGPSVECVDSVTQCALYRMAGQGSNH
ncbi:hypothetical protein GGI15_001396 [Coemansia interrupta]|uniref:Peroxisome assembly protein 22 n=1 Tax=Coemansia interrupta TaxID=1126814 RepID=A0A9W8LMZ7_9FUNG|nr:hypothetical protein GGI15_001396 [Coemansia interrupta]